MAPNAESTSPKSSTAQTKIQDGRIEKPRVRKGEMKSPNYSIAGRTFACQSCKKGHRVSKCTHALERPVHMTNDPGRPSADQKRHCDCPKQCSCTKKNCKCARNCICTQVMYMLVHVPFEKQEKQTESGKASSGEWKIDKEVITDLKGNQLSDEQIRERARLKSLQKQDSDSIKVESPDGRSLADPAASNYSNAADGVSSAAVGNPAKSCCTHKSRMQDTASIHQESVTTQTSITERPRCNCGTNCSCAFCLDHPNNSTSQQIAKQQAAHFVEQGFVGGLGNWQPYASSDPFTSTSCMGTNPRFAMHSQPNPSSAELQGLFGGSTAMEQGYYLSYPISGPSWTVQATGPLVHSNLLTPTLVSGPTMPSQESLSGLDSSWSRQESFIPAGAPLPGYINLSAAQLAPSADFQLAPTPMQIGYASVSSFQGGFESWPDPNLLWTSPDIGKWLPTGVDEHVLQDLPTINHDDHASTAAPFHELILQNDIFDYQHIENITETPSLSSPTKHPLHPNIATPQRLSAISDSSRPCCQHGASRSPAGYDFPISRTSPTPEQPA